MKTLIFYDEQGTIVFSKTGENVQESVLDSSVVEIPEGKYIKKLESVDGGFVPVFEDIPPSQIETLANTIEQLRMEQAEANAELFEMLFASL